MKQYIIVRKDLNMTKGKMASQVSHASMAFLTNLVRKNGKKIMGKGYYIASVYTKDKYRRTDLQMLANKAKESGKESFIYYMDDNYQISEVDDESILPYYYHISFDLDRNIFEKWINGIFTKIILEAKNKNKLLWALDKAKELGINCYPIYDNCLTELTPEEEDGTTLTCIGFPPLNSDVIREITKKYQLFKE